VKSVQFENRNKTHTRTYTNMAFSIMSTQQQQQQQQQHQQQQQTTRRRYHSPDDLKYDSKRSVEAQVRKQDALKAHAAAVSEQLPKLGVELEYTIGFTGLRRHMLCSHPVKTTQIIYGVGSKIVIGDVIKAHKQTILRGHTCDVTAIAMSPSGDMIASGQAGDPDSGIAAYVLVWHVATGKVFHKFEQLSTTIKCLAFSPDNRMLAMSDESGRFCVQDLKSGEQAHIEKQTHAITTCCWAPIVERKAVNTHGTESLASRNSYTFFSASGSVARFHTMQWSSRSMGYTVQTTDCLLASRGINRTFLCCSFDDAGKYLYAGTLCGEIIMLNVQKASLTDRIAAGSGAVRGIQVDGHTLLCGSADGQLSRLGITGHDNKWRVTTKRNLGAPISSVQFAAGKKYILVGCTSGLIVSVDPQDMQAAILVESHTHAVVDVAISPENDSFATIGEDGRLIVRDMVEYAVLAKYSHPVPNVKGTALQLLPEQQLVAAGWSDGSLTLLSIKDNGSVVWNLQSAHRGAVTAITLSSDGLVTGGQDGVVRVWSVASARMKQQNSQHRGAIHALVTDCVNDDIIHSVGADRTVQSLSVSKGRALSKPHQAIDGGSFTGMSQRSVGENELLTSSSRGELLMWDCDYGEPVAVKRITKSTAGISCVSVTNDGKLAAVGTFDGKLCIVDIATMHVIKQRTAHSACVRKLAWSTDQQQVVTVGDDSCIGVWNVFTA
jgi:cilia- and flagella-associated protein 52